ncbi:hypothetical protein [Paenibacillus agilis]|uniref:Uncharacterized protein n=1 Tax=Paenibacillus agilis TaxID=3020863 RepID=A0A559ID50_9BACL|nr:hypothetical protein [Paenibacillus agilis]TVX85565.1 hypothetical protein FPZ44_24730 [Paenibacillus agilis]
MDKELKGRLNKGAYTEMEIKVFENGSKQKLIAYLVEENGDKRELVRTDKGRDDLLNQIDDMNLSHLTVEFM